MQQKTPFLKFWKTNLPFSNFEKSNSLCRHSPTLLLCSDKDNWCLMPRMDEAKYFLGLCFMVGSFFEILKNKTPFIVSAGIPSSLTAYRKCRSVRCKSSNTTSYSAMWMLFVSHALFQKEFCWLQYYQKFSLWPINSTPSESEKNSFWASTKLPPYIYIINRNKEIKNKIIIFKNNDRQ